MPSPPTGCGQHTGLGGFLDKVGKIFKKVGHTISEAYHDVRDEVVRVARVVLHTAARSAAVEIGFRIAGTIITAGIGAPLIQLGVSAASRFSGADLDNALAQASGAASEATATDAVTSVNAAQWAEEHAELIVEAARMYAPILAPEQTNKALQEIAKFANQVDAFGTLYTMAFTELTIQADASKKRRDELRVRIAEIKASVVRRGGVWLMVAKHAYQALQTVVIAIATAGTGLPIIAGITALDAVQFAMSAAQMALELENAAELARISREKLREQRATRAAADAAETKRLEEEIARLEEEIRQLGGLGRDGQRIQRSDLDPGIVAVLSPEGGGGPGELISLERALGLQFGVMSGPSPPTLEEILVPKTETRPHKITAFMHKSIKLTSAKPGR